MCPQSAMKNSLFDKETLSRTQIPPDAEICQLKTPFNIKTNNWPF